MSISVQIVTPERPIFSGACTEVRAPSALGEIGVLPGHRALLAALDAGRVLIQATGGSESYAVSGGFIEVSDDTVTILAEHAIAASDIDTGAVKSALSEAQEALRTMGPSDESYAANLAKANWSRAQLLAKS
jgi:F-type H+-transporting ATPase subunit epsilon